MMFEEWAARLDYSLEGTAIKGRRYSSENTEQAFRGWNAAIEEAAKACESRAELRNASTMGRAFEASDCADLIRRKLKA